MPPVRHTTGGRNTSGSNQHQEKPHRMYIMCLFLLCWRLTVINWQVEVAPQLPELIQAYLNEGVMQKDLPDMLREDHKIIIL